MASNHPDEVTRVLKELDEAVNETARLQEAVEGTQPQHPQQLQHDVPPEDDRRRNERRGVVDDRRNSDRRDGDPSSDS